MMASKGNAAASLGKVDKSPLLQHFSTFFPRMYSSFVYWQSCGGGASIRKQATFFDVGKPKSMRDLRGEFCEVAIFHSTHAQSQTKTGCGEQSLFSTRNKVSQRRRFAKGLDEAESPHSE